MRIMTIAAVAALALAGCNYRSFEEGGQWSARVSLDVNDPCKLIVTSFYDRVPNMTARIDGCVTTKQEPAQ
jgi:hypothetical protein